MSSLSRHRGRAVWTLVALVAALSSSCRFVGTRAHNLTELHDDAGRHKRSGAILTDFAYGWLVGVGAAIPGVETKEAEIKKIPKPLVECVKNMDKLNGFSSKNPRTAAVQVRFMAWLAIDDPWKLSREIAVRELGEHGERLGVTVAPDVEGEPATAEEVRDTISRLVAAMRSTLGQDVVEATGPEDDIVSACAFIDTMPLDRNGGLRLLRAATVLEAQVDKNDERIDPVRQTIVRLERVCVREALRLALRDAPPREVSGSHPGWNSPVVRAAAVGACVRAFGGDALGEMLLTLDREFSPEVLVAVFREVRRRGLPEPPEIVTAEDAERLRQRWIDLILLQATEHPNGTVRIAAMRALSTVSGNEVKSLREEDWLAWVLERDAAVEAENL